MRFRHASILLLAVAPILAAADNPFIGKWKLNPAKSEFTGTTVSFEQTAPEWKMTSDDGQSYKFKMDGKDYPAINGSVASWKQVDNKTWETTYKINGVLISTGILKVSADGKTMTGTSKGKKPNGEAFENSGTSQRVSGGPGLAGKWKSTEVKISSPDVFEIAAYDGDGISWTVPAWGATFNAKFDGKDYHGKGPTIPAGYTMALRKTGLRSFEIVDKMEGKVTDTATETVSADGKTWTEVMTMAGSKEKTKAVYERQ